MWAYAENRFHGSKQRAAPAYQDTVAGLSEELLFVVGSLDDGIAAAKKLIEQGVEIIIACGETAYNIRDMFPSRKA